MIRVILPYKLADCGAGSLGCYDPISNIVILNEDTIVRNYGRYLDWLISGNDVLLNKQFKSFSSYLPMKLRTNSAIKIQMVFQDEKMIVVARKTTAMLLTVPEV